MKAIIPFTLLSAAVGGALYLMTHVSASGRVPMAVPKLTAGDVVKEGSIVALEYTLTDESGKVIESSEGKSPMVYVHGQGQIMPGLEKALTGMKVGEQKTVVVRPEEGYGPVNPQAFQEVPRENFPAEGLKVGMTLMARGKDGVPIRIRVREIKDKTVVVDLNHPLAGKTLTFKVKISEIKTAAN
jgi:FKBP-type peptidyl-prolyl cis-trans isomerase SlyD